MMHHAFSYSQILPYIADHFPPTFERAHFLVSCLVYICINFTYHFFLLQLYFISSASSFYFVYDFCLLDGLHPLLAYLFRYTPLFIAILVCPSLLIIRYTEAWQFHVAHEFPFY